MKKVFVSDMSLSIPVNETEKELSFREKLEIAKKIVKSGADALELPLLSDNKEDVIVFRTIASACDECMVCVPGGDSEESINNAYECIKECANPCIQIVLPVSTVQMEYIYHLKSAKMLDKIAFLCKTASAVCKNVEFVAQDASRAEKGFAGECCKTAFENGAYAVTLCDDNGDYFPNEFAELVKDVKASCGAKVYVKPSDKLSMAAANAVAAIEAGADGIKTAAVGGQWLSSDAVADILRARGEKLGVYAGLDITAIHNIMADLTSCNKGYELPEVEDSDAEQIHLGGESTISDVISAVANLGYELSDEDHGRVYEEFKRVCAKRGSIGKQELEAVIASSAMQVPSTFHVVNYVINSGNIITATANITLEKNGEKLTGVSTGDGPIDAAFQAIEQIVGHRYELDDFHVQAVTKGKEAVGSSIIRLRDEGRIYSGNGVSTDIVGACIRAYVNALNKIVYEKN